MRFVLAALSILSMFAGACSRRAACDYEHASCQPGETCAFVEGGSAKCVAFSEEPLELSPPLRRDAPFWCSQGGRSKAGHSHSFQGDLFALDLAATSTSDPVELVAPIDGTAYVYDECEERSSDAKAFNDSKCGLGYGNHVKIWDGRNIYLFGHLARALVKPGPVKRDDAIGVMGSSGAAGSRHVHVTVTRPNPGQDPSEILKTPGITGDVPVRYRLVARDAASLARIVAEPDVLACDDDRSRTKTLVR